MTSMPDGLPKRVLTRIRPTRSPIVLISFRNESSQENIEGNGTMVTCDSKRWKPLPTGTSPTTIETSLDLGIRWTLLLQNVDDDATILILLPIGSG